MGRHNLSRRPARRKVVPDCYDITQMYLPELAGVKYIVCDEYKAGVENMAALPGVRRVKHMSPGPRWERLMMGE